MTDAGLPDLHRHGAGPLQAYAASRAEHDPVPPRDVPLGDIVRLSYGSWPMRIAAAAALLLGLAVVAAAIALWRIAVDPFLLLMLGVLFGIGIPLVPLVAGLRVRRTIRDGTLVRAEVIEISERATRGEGPDAPTRVVGTASHRVPDGTARIPFDIEAPWAAEIDRGDGIVGLVGGRGAPLWLGTTVDRGADGT